MKKIKKKLMIWKKKKKKNKMNKNNKKNKLLNKKIN